MTRIYFYNRLIFHVECLHMCGHSLVTEDQNQHQDPYQDHNQDPTCCVKLELAVDRILYEHFFIIYHCAWSFSVILHFLALISVQDYTTSFHITSFYTTSFYTTSLPILSIVFWFLSLLCCFLSWLVYLYRRYTLHNPHYPNASHPLEREVYRNYCSCTCENYECCCCCYCHGGCPGWIGSANIWNQHLLYLSLYFAISILAIIFHSWQPEMENEYYTLFLLLNTILLVPVYFFCHIASTTAGKGCLSMDEMNQVYRFRYRHRHRRHQAHIPDPLADSSRTVWDLDKENLPNEHKQEHTQAQAQVQLEMIHVQPCQGQTFPFSSLSKIELPPSSNPNHPLPYPFNAMTTVSVIGEDESMDGNNNNRNCISIDTTFPCSISYI